MEEALRYLLVGTRGGENRARIIRVLSDRPHNANRLADRLDTDYNTVHYQLDTLVDHDIVEAGEHDYGKPYFLTDRFEHHCGAFERLTDRMD